MLTSRISEGENQNYGDQCLVYISWALDP